MFSKRQNETKVSTSTLTLFGIDAMTAGRRAIIEENLNDCRSWSHQAKQLRSRIGWGYRNPQCNYLLIGSSTIYMTHLVMLEIVRVIAQKSNYVKCLLRAITGIGSQASRPTHPKRFS